MADFVIGDAPLDDPFAPTSQPRSYSSVAEDQNRVVHHDTIGRGKWGIADKPLDDPFGPAQDPSSAEFIGASAKSGMWALAGAGARLLDAVNPFTLSEDDAAILFKDKPEEFQKFRDESAANFMGRFIRSMNDNADAARKDISPETQRAFGDRVYATVDPSKAAWASPTRVVGDALASAPTSLALMATAWLSRGASLKAEQQALAAGATAEAARKIGVEAAAKTMATYGAVSEGAIGAAQQGDQTRSEMEQMPMSRFAESDAFKALIEQGFAPETARAVLIGQAAAGSAVSAGLVDSTVNAVGGEFLGKILSEGGPFVSRVLKGYANEGITETLQSAGEQMSQNAGIRDTIDPNQSLWEGVPEQAIAGGVVGGVTGAATAGVFGRNDRPAANAGGDAVPPASPAAPTGAASQVTEPTTLPLYGPQEQPEQAFPNLTPQDIASPLDNAVISRGKALFEGALQPGAPDRARAAEQAAQQQAANADPNWTEVLGEDDRPNGMWVNRKTGKVSMVDPRQKGALNVPAEPAALAAPRPAPLSGADAPAAAGMEPVTEPLSEPTAPARLSPETGAVDNAIASRPSTGAGQPAIGRPVASQRDEGAITEPAGQMRPAEPPTTPSTAPASGPAAAEIERAANEAATSPVNDLPEPTQAQKEAGNYKVGRLKVGGMDISVENPKGSERKGIDSDGEAWSVTMPAHYGYVRRTVGADGDHVDVYVGDHPESQKAFVVDQVDAKTGKFDEHKAVLGTNSLEEAQRLYDAGFSDGKGPQRRGAVTEMSVDQFRDWAMNGDTKRPLSDQMRRPGLTPKSQRVVDTTPRTATETAPFEPREPTPEALQNISDNAKARADAQRPGLTPVSKRPKKPESLFSLKALAGGVQGNEAPARRTGAVGDKFSAGEVVRTATGRDTSPFPNIDTSTNGKAGNTVKRIDRWLMQNALDEARARGDDFNARQFEHNLDRPSQADKDSAEMYLFDKDMVQPVPKPFLKPMSAPDDKPPIPGDRQDGETGISEYLGLKPGMKVEAKGRSGGPYAIEEMWDRTSGPAPMVMARIRDEAGRKVTVNAKTLSPLRAEKPAPTKSEVVDTVASPDGESEWRIARLKDGRFSALMVDKGTGNAVNAEAGVRIFPTQGAARSYVDGEIGKAVKAEVKQRSDADEGKARDLESRVRAWAAEGKPWFEIYSLLKAEGPMPDSRMRRASLAFQKYNAESPVAGVDEEPAKAAEAGKPATEQDQPVKTEKPDGYGAGNKVFTADAAAKARAVLRAKLKNQLSAGLDPEIVQAGITLAGYHIEAGARSFAAYSKAMIDDLGETVRPYLRSWYEGVRYHPTFDATGMTPAAEIDRSATETENPAAEEKPAAKEPAKNEPKQTGSALANRFRDEFVNGTEKLNIIKARKIASEVTGEPIVATSPMAKTVEEQIEAGIVMASRDVVAKGGTPGAIFDKLRAIYERQPLLTTRTSNSMDLQAYSTPAPLAFVASRLAGVRDASNVYEPTAGNGMLLMEATPASIEAVEIDPDRAATLREIYGAASTTIADATTYTPENRPDVVITNPPFGRRSINGGPQRWDISGYKTPEIDHAIAWRALSAMQDDGSAVLILGGKPGTDEERITAYRADAVRAFFKKLYDGYNVVDHFTVDGKLYSRQGASWPVDVIVIKGRGASALEMPMATPPKVLTSWDEVKGKLDGVGTEAAGQRGNVGRNRPAGEAGRAAVADGVQAPAREADRRAGEEGNARDGARPAADRGAERAAGDSGRSERGRGTAGGQQRVAEQPSGNPVQQDAAERVAPGAAEPVGRDVGRDAGNVLDDALSHLDGGQRRVAPKRKNNETETNYQVRYNPTSKAAFAVGTLVPRNMQTAMSRALDDLSRRVGDIDKFVADRLGYSAKEMLGTATDPGYFSAEQVDALALAIDNVERGAGFIVGDQTGIGKGRFVAGMLRYAQRAGRVPVFVTQNPGLYADMVRDMRDIGMTDISGRIFVTNNDLRGAQAIPLSTTGDTADLLSALAPAPHKAAVDEMMKTGRPPAGFDMVFTTYSQLQYAAEGAETNRQRAMMALSPNAMFVLDESHEAGGTGDTPSRFTKKGEVAKNRAQFVRDMIRSALGVVYSSATYAKNPTVMSLYYKTDLALAVSDVKELPEVIQSGGVPLQQVVANMLVEAGQYARRERSFAGIEIRLDQLKTDPEVASRTSAALRRMFTLDLEHMQDARAEFIANSEKVGMKGGKDAAVGEASASSTNFASTMHNLVAQMLLALKAEQVANQAIELYRAGEKPIIALSNTNEQIIDDFVEENGIQPGQKASVSFNIIMERYVQRLRRITLKDENGKPKHVFMTDEDIRTFGGSGALKEFRAVEKQIREMDLGNLPGSPIDYILDRMAEAGIKVDEITGRKNTLRNGVLSSRVASAAAKKSVMNAYNAGRIDALVINKSGSTGFSMHATDKKGNDGKPRHMILLQPDPNIDVFMQMLGRINRTGQTKLPRYTIAVSDLAVEKRPAAALMRKMSSLNANTTASKRSAVSLDVTDFMNKYGDEVVAQFLTDNPDLSAATGVKVPTADKREGLAARFTGRLAILDPKEVTDIYDQIESAYREYVESLDRLGQNALEARTMDIGAKTISSTVLVPAREGSSSPFTAPAFLETVDAKKLGEPYTMDELRDEVKKAMGDAPGPAAFVEKIGHTLRSKLPALMTRLNARLAAAEAKFAEASTAKQKESAADAIAAIRNQMSQTEASLDDNIRLIGEMRPGRGILVETYAGEEQVGSVPGVIIGVDINKVRDNPNAASMINVRIAIADATREVRIPLSMLKGDQPSYKIVDHPINDVRKAFESGAAEVRETRQIITGNLVSGFATFKKGQFVVFTDENGDQRQGILMARDFDAKKELDRQPVQFETGEQVVKFLTDGKNRLVQSDDQALAISVDGGRFMVAANLRGGKPYFLLKAARDIVGDFQQRRGDSAMRATATADQVTRLIAAYQDNLGTKFRTSANKEEARAIVGGEGAPTLKMRPGGPDPDILSRIDALSATPDGWGTADTSNDVPAITPAQIEELNGIIRRVSGLDDVRYQDSITVDASKVTGGAAWGKTEGEINAGGAYANTPAGDFIMVALNQSAEGARRTAYHESFHRLQRKFMTASERRALKADMGKLRALVASTMGREAQASAMADSEIEAEAFAIYATAKDGAGDITSIPLRARAAFARLYRMVRAVRNWLNGAGFQTYEDVFSRAMSGEMAQRQANDIGGPAIQPMQFSLFGDHEEAIHDVLADKSRRWSERFRDAMSRNVLSETLTRFRYGMQDDVVDLKLVQSQIANVLGRDLFESENAYLQRELADSKAHARIDKIHDDMVAPILTTVGDTLHNANVQVAFGTGSETYSGLDLLNVYLYAQHAPERNAYIAGINPKMPDGGSGMTDADAGAVLSAVRKAGLTKDLDALAKQVRRLIDYSLDVRLKAGLMSQDQVDAWRNQYTNYVPLRGFEDPTGDDPAFARYGSGSSVRGPESKRAFGRRSRAGDIFAHVILGAQEAVIRAERNQIALALHELASTNPNDEFWKVNKVEIKPYWNATKQQVEYRASRNLTRVEEDHTVFGKLNGAEFRITFNHQNPRARRLAEALRNLRGREAGIIMKVFGPVTRYVARINTAMNPVFVVTNAFRDLQAASINLAQYNIPGLGMKTRKHYLALASSTFGRLAKGKVELTPEWKRWHDEFTAAGGRTSWSNLEDVDEIRRRMDRDIAAAKSGNKVSALRAVKAFGHAIEMVNDAVENSIRLSAYRAAREAGLSRDAAASIAKNVTVNFNRHGVWGPVINSMYAFFNAGMQGTATTLIAMKSPRVRKILAGIALTGLTLTMFNKMASGDDDDGESFYDKIPDYVRQKNVILMLPGTRGKYLSFPMPWGYNVFHSVGRVAAELAFGRKPLEAVADLAGGMVDAFNPMGSGSLLNTFAPTLFDPVVDLTMNRDFAGRPIKPDPKAYQPDVPEAQKYWNSVSPVAKGVTDALTALTGGDKVVRGYIDISPEVLEYLFGQVTGSAGRFYLDVADLPMKALDPEAKILPNDIPFVGKVVGSKASWVDRAAFYERIGEIDKAKAEVKRYGEKGMPDAARSHADATKNLLRLESAAKTAEKEMRAIRKARGALYQAHELGRVDSATFRDQLARIKDAEEKVVMTFNGIYNKHIGD